MKRAYKKIFRFSLLLATFFVSEKLLAQVEFVENKGQWAPDIQFMSDAGSGSFYLTKNGFAVTQYNPQDVENIKIRRHEADIKGNTLNRNIKDTLRNASYSVEFLNAETPQIIPDKAVPSVNNYFIGNDKSKWASNCKIYLGVTYKNIYPNIDLRYYTDAAGNLKYDFIINPGAKIDDIAMKYKGAKNLSVKNRELNITTALGVNKELQPYTYQVINNQKQELDCRYIIKGDVVKFKVKNYSPDQTLIIDPTLIFFSYSGSTADNWGFTATYGPDGSFYGGGIAFGNGFPVNPNASDQSFNGDFDIAIIKLSADGRNRIYATYIGGNGEEQPHSLIVDQQGNLVIAGRSNSSDYPVKGQSFGKGGGFDIVVTKLNASGSDIIGSLKIGGSGNDGVNIADDHSNYLQSLKRNYGDDARSEVILDAADNIYVASCTSSSGTSVDNGAFPTTTGAFQTQLSGKQDAVVLKLNPDCNSVLFSTLLGGKDDDAAYVLTLGNNGSVYVAGGTASSDFFKNIPTTGVIRPSNANLSSSGASGKDPCDGFVVELNNSGTTAVRGTYIGTDKADQIYGIETDKFGFIYVMGTSEGNMPVINAQYSNAGAKQFISKLKPDLSEFIYSTVFGSTNALVPNISPTAFLVDRCQNVYVSGWGGKANTGFSSGNTKGMPVTPDAIKLHTDASGSDFYFFVLKKDAVSQLYGSFFGQEDPPGRTPPVTFGDHVDGGTSRFDQNGVIYQGICANCFKSVPFPGSPPGVWSQTNQSQGENGACNLGMLKIEMDFAGVRSGLHTSIDGVSNDTSGCVPLQVDFSDTLKKGKLYYWYFGDGGGDTTTTPASSHVYQKTGIYPVMLVTIDSTTCNIADTSYKNIKVGDNKVNLDFLSQKIPPCTNLSYSFTNISTPTHGTFQRGIFTWDFGDNTPLVVQTQNPVNHTFAGPGTYKVKLSLNDSTYCNSPDDTVKTVRLSPQVKALFTTPAKGCVPYNAVFANNSLGGLNFFWDFGDGTSSTEDNPTHLYSKTGTYTVKLTAFDSTSCNKTDVTSFTITVSPIPQASFTYNPLVPKENTFTNFQNQSVEATTYLWNFGDGDTSNEVNPKHIFAATDTYNVCLNAANDFGCSDDTCIKVQSIIKPLVDVPSGFTPGKFGANSIIKVVGFGIKEMHWSIYNRWGQKVYESNSTKSGWDGTFNGKLQPMDVYAYTLEVTFSDGKKVRKTGDITLLR